MSKKPFIKQLNRFYYSLLSRAVSTEGSYNPDDCMYLIEEELTPNEYYSIVAFLSWCHTNNKMFGSGNYQQIYKEFYNQI